MYEIAGRGKKSPKKLLHAQIPSMGETGGGLLQQCYRMRARWCRDHKDRIREERERRGERERETKMHPRLGPKKGEEVFFFMEGIAPGGGNLHVALLSEREGKPGY